MLKFDTCLPLWRVAQLAKINRYRFFQADMSFAKKCKCNTTCEPLWCRESDGQEWTHLELEDAIRVALNRVENIIGYAPCPKYREKTIPLRGQVKECPQWLRGWKNNNRFKLKVSDCTVACGGPLQKQVISVQPVQYHGKDHIGLNGEPTQIPYYGQVEFEFEEIDPEHGSIQICIDNETIPIRSIEHDGESYSLLVDAAYLIDRALMAEFDITQIDCGCNVIDFTNPDNYLKEVEVSICHIGPPKVEFIWYGGDSNPCGCGSCNTCATCEIETQVGCCMVRDEWKGLIEVELGETFKPEKVDENEMAYKCNPCLRKASKCVCKRPPDAVKIGYWEGDPKVCSSDLRKHVINKTIDPDIERAIAMLAITCLPCPEMDCECVGYTVVSQWQFNMAFSSQEKGGYNVSWNKWELGTQQGEVKAWEILKDRIKEVRIRGGRVR